MTADHNRRPRFC